MAKEELMMNTSLALSTNDIKNANDNETTFESDTTYTFESDIDAVFKKYDINILISPAERCGLRSYRRYVHTRSLSKKIRIITEYHAGYPIASLPVGYLDLYGRPHGLAAMALAHDEALLVQLQSAWEASFPARIPPALVSNAKDIL
jgi:Asp-tRNA(Asn)/Glu-tRNA(Gln) amidotransferase A subunit family amidase